MRAIGGNEVQLDPTSRSCQLRLHQFPHIGAMDQEGTRQPLTSEAWLAACLDAIASVLGACQPSGLGPNLLHRPAAARPAREHRADGSEGGPDMMVVGQAHDNPPRGEAGAPAVREVHPFEPVSRYTKRLVESCRSHQMASCVTYA